MKRIISLLGAALLSHLLLAQNVEQVTIGDNMNYGITYRLPQTAIRITVRAHCVKTEAGTFAPYAEKLLGLTDAAQSDEDTLTDVLFWFNCFIIFCWFRFISIII